MKPRRTPPRRPRLHVEELEPRLLYSADAALLLDPTLGGLAEVRVVAPPAAPLAAALQAVAAQDPAQ
ncbi:MAG TPA: LEPR-XLL domain-containing protein, partial [Burkholderiaceae bacterium]|nr:LEPR-XLL domain-containing protein [Burkholderiaceae bacterium]